MKAWAHIARRHIVVPSSVLVHQLLQAVPASPGPHSSGVFINDGSSMGRVGTHLVSSSTCVNEKDSNFCMRGFHSKMERRVACSQ